MGGLLLSAAYRWSDRAVDHERPLGRYAMCERERERQRRIERPSLLLYSVSSIPADPNKTVTPRKSATGHLT